MHYKWWNKIPLKSTKENTSSVINTIANLKGMCTQCKIWGSHSSDDEKSSLRACYVMLLYKYVPAFQRIVAHSWVRSGRHKLFNQQNICASSVCSSAEHLMDQISVYLIIDLCFFVHMLLMFRWSGWIETCCIYNKLCVKSINLTSFLFLQ
jgi:hypothetical protein